MTGATASVAVAVAAQGSSTGSRTRSVAMEGSSVVCSACGRGGRGGGGLPEGMSSMMAGTAALPGDEGRTPRDAGFGPGGDTGSAGIGGASASSTMSGSSSPGR